LKKTPRFYPRTRSALVFKIVCVYYATLLGFIAYVVYTQRFWSGGIFPASWQTALVCLYYLAPLLIAFVFGLLFRPFWNHFRDLLMSIFLVHLLYSIGIYGWRQAYLNERQEVITQSSLAEIRAESFSHRLLDNDHDGRVDEVALWGRLNVRELPPGRYITGIVLSQGNELISDGLVAKSGFQKGDKGEVDLKFSFDPRRYGQRFEHPVRMDLYIYRVVEVSEEAEQITWFSRWTPFLRTTSWQGQDQDFYGDLVRIEIIYGVDSVKLLMF